MAIIPAEEKVFMVSNSTNTTYSGSAALKAMQQWYTMDDVTNTVRPYKVYTALLTQSGVNDPVEISSGLLDIGVSYRIVYCIAGDDFRNVGGPLVTADDDPLINGTYFVATGTTPANWTHGTGLEYNLGAPVVTVLENTLGFNPYWNILINGFYYTHIYDTIEREKVVTCNIGTFSQNIPGVIVDVNPSISFDDGSDLPNGTNFVVTTTITYIDTTSENPLLYSQLTSGGESVLLDYIVEIRVYN